MIQIQMSLLDAMSSQMGCAYLSDLRFGDGTQRGILAGKLENIPATAADLRDWNEALEYLTGDSRPMADAEQAKAALIAALAGGQMPDFL